MSRKTAPNKTMLRDRRQHPLTEVFDMDNPLAPPRRVSLPPQMAVLWCVSWDMGDQGGNLDEYQAQLMFVKGEWVCGKYKAKAVPPPDPGPV